MGRLRSSLAVSAVAVMVLAAGAAAWPVPCQAQADDGEQVAGPPQSPGAEVRAAPVPTAPIALAAPTAPSVEAPSLPVGAADGVVAAVREVSPGAEVGLVVWDRASGSALVETGASVRYQSASLVKLLVAIAAERAEVDGDRVRRMLRVSDDGVASGLWGLLGGDSLPGTVAASLGIRGVGGPDIPGRWGNVLLSAADVVVVYRYLLERHPALVAALTDAPRRAADGFDQHFGIPSAFSGPWAVKQAWGTSGQATTAHTTGVVDERYVVVLLTSHPGGTGFGVATAAASAGAEALAAAMP